MAQTDNACLFCMTTEKTRRSSKSADQSQHRYTKQASSRSSV